MDPNPADTVLKIISKWKGPGHVVVDIVGADVNPYPGPHIPSDALIGLRLQAVKAGLLEAAVEEIDTELSEFSRGVDGGLVPEGPRRRRVLALLTRLATGSLPEKKRDKIQSAIHVLNDISTAAHRIRPEIHESPALDDVAACFFGCSVNVLRWPNPGVFDNHANDLALLAIRWCGPDPFLSIISQLAGHVLLPDIRQRHMALMNACALADPRKRVLAVAQAAGSLSLALREAQSTTTIPSESANVKLKNETLKQAAKVGRKGRPPLTRTAVDGYLSEGRKLSCRKTNGKTPTLQDWATEVVHGLSLIKKIFTVSAVHKQMKGRWFFPQPQRVSDSWEGVPSRRGSGDEKGRK